MTKEEVTEISYEGQLARLDQKVGWHHPGRKAQRIIAGGLFLLGSIWAVVLFLSLFALIGILFNVIFIFGWLIYGGWFYVLIGKAMSVSLRFFWMASIVIHAGYGFLFSWRGGEGIGSWYDFNEALLTRGWAWWIPMIASLVALGCEQWTLRTYPENPKLPV